MKDSAIKRVDGRQRFEALLSGEAGAMHDRPLLDRGEWIVAPTLGAVIADWLLALPRRRVLSFRDWAAMGGKPALSLLSDVRAELGLDSSEVIWFEHGPAKTGTVVGCGLDHAHLHILIRPPFSFEEFAERARAEAMLHWFETSASECYPSLDASLSYCVAGSGDRAITALGVEEAGSQFFRRVVAGLTGAMREWDYRKFAHSQNIGNTVATFERLQSAARREF